MKGSAEVSTAHGNTINVSTRAWQVIDLVDHVIVVVWHVPAWHINADRQPVRPESCVMGKTWPYAMYWFVQTNLVLLLPLFSMFLWVCYSRVFALVPPQLHRCGVSGTELALPTPVNCGTDSTARGENVKNIRHTLCKWEVKISGWQPIALKGFVGSFVGSDVCRERFKNLPLVLQSPVVLVLKSYHYLLFKLDFKYCAGALIVARLAFQP